MGYVELRWILFLVPALGVLAAQHLYLYRRLVRDTARSKWLRRAGLLAVAIAATSMFSGRLLFRVAPGPLVRAFADASMLWMGLSLYLFLFLGAFELRRLWPRPSQRATPPVDVARRLFVSRTAAGAALLASGGSMAYGFHRAHAPPEVTELPLKLPGLPKALDGFTIAQVSDIHAGGFVDQKFLTELVRRCNPLRPDLVAITGDLVDGEVDTLGPVVAALRGLHSRHGTYFVTGNHEYYSGVGPWTSALPKMGISVLRNRRVEVGEVGASFDLIGVDDWHSRGRTDGYDLDAALAGRDPSRASVLLAHQPSNFEAVAERGVGLQLSGHTHGGQFFPATLFAPLVFRYHAGHYTQGASHLYVSRGTGYWGPPIRIGSPAEIVKVVLLA
ncbi:MAG: metallophosphoesterase [Myxococcales bacterium]|nr:metallophosphoesterase [Myxococcales bacterium]